MNIRFSSSSMLLRWSLYESFRPLVNSIKVLSILTIGRNPIPVNKTYQNEIILNTVHQLSRCHYSVTVTYVNVDKNQHVMTHPHLTQLKLALDWKNWTISKVWTHAPLLSQSGHTVLPVCLVSTTRRVQRFPSLYLVSTTPRVQRFPSV